MASKEARFDSSACTTAVQALASRIATLAHARLARLIAETTTLLDDENDPLDPQVKHALVTYASRFFQGFENDVLMEILDHIHVSELEAG
jgi:hypothetical protein